MGINDFSVTGTTAMVTNVTSSNSSVYDVVISGGDLGSLNGTVGLNLNGSPSITDAAGNPLQAGEPGIDETYTLDNIAPSSDNRASFRQADPASGPPVNFTVVFSEPINVSTFTAGDITQNGTIPPATITWNI